jgi:hypothetical protein
LHLSYGRQLPCRFWCKRLFLAINAIFMGLVRLNLGLSTA